MEAHLDIIDRHFAAESAHDVAATLATYADDIVWDDVTHSDAPFHGKEQVGQIYTAIIDAIPDLVLESVKRFTGEEGRNAGDELRNGLISYENAWFDAAEVQRQLLAWKAGIS